MLCGEPRRPFDAAGPAAPPCGRPNNRFSQGGPASKRLSASPRTSAPLSSACSQHLSRPSVRPLSCPPPRLRVASAVGRGVTRCGVGVGDFRFFSSCCYFPPAACLSVPLSHSLASLFVRRLSQLSSLHELLFRVNPLPPSPSGRAIQITD